MVFGFVREVTEERWARTVRFWAVGKKLAKGSKKELHWKSSGMAILDAFASGFLFFYFIFIFIFMPIFFRFYFSFFAIAGLEHHLLWIGPC